MLRDVLPVFVATRLFFVAITLLVPWWRVVSGVPPLILHRSTGTPFDAWNRWDTRWYDDLARIGYNLRGPDDFKNVVFFPLYPLLIRTVHDVIAVIGRDVLGLVTPDPTFPPYLWAGLLVANLCSAGALVFLYSLVRLDYGRAAARRTVTLFTLSPLAFFLFTAYSEGTFLLCAIACFYMLRLRRWWQAGLWGLLAAATRPPGAVLVVPFLMVWAQAHPVVAGPLLARVRLTWRGVKARGRLAHVRLWRPATALTGPAAVPLVFEPEPSGGSTPRRRAGSANSAQAILPGRRSRTRAPVPRWHQWPAEVRQAVRHAAPAVAIPLGLGLFMAFLFKVFGDPLLFSHAQTAWWRTFAPPWETFVLSISWPVGDLLHGTLWGPHFSALHDLIYELVGLPLTWLAWRRLARVEGVYVWLLWLVVLSSPAMLIERVSREPHHDVLMSLPRMMLMMFPLFTYLGLQRRLYPRLAGAFAVALGIYTGIYLTDGWIS